MPFYWGENFCQAKKKDSEPCKNKAYFTQTKLLLCGVHSQKSKRSILPKNPDRDKIEKEKYEEHMKVVKTCAKKNKLQNKKGDCY